MIRLRTAILTTAFILALISTAGFLFLRTNPFGSDPAGTRLDRIQRSPHYRDGSFQNLTPTTVMRQDASYRTMLMDYVRKSPANVPAQPLPTVKTDLNALPGDQPTVVWFGHSSYLIKSGETTVLVDPVFSGYASPVSFFGKAFPGTNVYTAADMPPIDLLVLSHDHYDHLDYETIVQLIPKVNLFCTALGVGAHLQRWGVPADRIVEFDWYEGRDVAPDIRLTAVPARHFSGRALARGRTLWTAFVLKLHGQTLFLGGDSGYGEHFRQIGQQYGPFDLALLECGQYGKDWPNIHMFPEEVTQAAVDLRAKTVLPVHWAKFALAYHAWNEPIERLTKQAAERHVPLTTPRIGEPVRINSADQPRTVWWNF